MVAFPDDGHPDLCYYVGDVDRDGLEEIVCWNQREVWIYRSEESGVGGEKSPDDFRRRTTSRTTAPR